VGYSDSASSKWVITDPGQKSLVQFTVSKLDLEDGYDFLIISKCSDVSCSRRATTEIARLTGTTEVANTYESDTGYMKIEMSTDGSNSGDGFKASWNVIKNCYCLTCPDGSFAPVGATDLSSCSCAEGFTGANGDTCTGELVDNKCGSGSTGPDGGSCPLCAGMFALITLPLYTFMCAHSPNC
jgi:hypothetical protein